MNKKIQVFSICFFAVCNLFSPVRAENASLQLLKSFYALEESEIDFAELKLSVDQIIYPKSDRAQTLAQIDEMTARIRAELPENTTSRQKVAVIRRHIYEAGDWNGGRAFLYDLDDPLGEKIENKLLSTYFRTRLGNCVSMPILFLIQADRFGIDVTLSTAPLHIFVKYYDEESGRYINLETTDGANPARDEWLRQNISMTDKSIESGIYLSTLSRRDVIGVVADTLMEYHWERGNYRQVLEVADVILREDEKNIVALVRYGSAAGKLIEEFQANNPVASNLNAFQRKDYGRLLNQNAGAFRLAESFGWRPEKAPTP